MSDYQGWANRATWAVKLHWDNYPGDVVYYTEQAKEFKKANKALWEFAEFLSDSYDEIFDSVIEGKATDEAKLMVRDVGNGDDVDWQEIAEAYFEGVNE